MKSMILVLTPRECAGLLNGDLSVLVRKRFPKDYVGWVYVYCTKGKPYTYDSEKYYFAFLTTERRFIKSNHLHMNNKEVYQYLNGKVVARFWCDKVEEIKWHKDTAIDLDYYKVVNVIENKEILKESCLQLKELEDYLQIKNAKNIPTTWGITFNLGYAIHITEVKPFDKPKELKEFIICRERKHKCRQKFSDYPCKKCVSMNLLTRAPRNGWCYVEV